MKRTIKSVALTVTFLLSLNNSVSADDISVFVKDTKGREVANAVVMLTPMFETDVSFSPVVKAEMRQENTLFKPFVLPVKAGTKVSFPNFDEFRHHVYSFSKARRFQLKLYGQDESKEILFDKTGMIALGCNIHDNMLAFIYVTEAPIYNKTASNGQVNFMNLPAGNYNMQVWHPDLKDRKKLLEKEIILKDSLQTEAVLKMRSTRRKQNGPAEDEYN